MPEAGDMPRCADDTQEASKKKCAPYLFYYAYYKIQAYRYLGLGANLGLDQNLWPDGGFVGGAAIGLAFDRGWGPVSDGRQAPASIK